ncbi:S26 family signal peptidase [Ruegeria sp. HKCCD8929]|uniref:S26 family signal peptidase n=1 Tax=Ruegeria sp. HKCCD8929 TaxID=2683006 RepID=UPI0014876D2B|nr:S26 family signal peptidase [Ruegeria sp. HKCCD8929]
MALFKTRFRIWPLVLLAMFLFHVLAFGRVAINFTDSLPSNAFAMVTWPRPLWRGAVVAVYVPDVIADKFGEHEVYLTKRIAGRPGDVVRRDGDQICIGGTCVQGERKNGELVSPLWEADVVPPGTIAVLGDSTDSLDSRYQVIGAIPESDIVAVGFAIPFPHWTSFAEGAE